MSIPEFKTFVGGILTSLKETAVERLEENKFPPSSVKKDYIPSQPDFDDLLSRFRKAEFGTVPPEDCPCAGECKNLHLGMPTYSLNEVTFGKVTHYYDPLWVVYRFLVKKVYGSWEAFLLQYAEEEEVLENEFFYLTHRFGREAERLLGNLLKEVPCRSEFGAMEDEERITGARGMEGPRGDPGPPGYEGERVICRGPVGEQGEPGPSGSPEPNYKFDGTSWLLVTGVTDGTYIVESPFMVVKEVKHEGHYLLVTKRLDDSRNFYLTWCLGKRLRRLLNSTHPSEILAWFPVNTEQYERILSTTEKYFVNDKVQRDNQKYELKPGQWNKFLRRLEKLDKLAKHPAVSFADLFEELNTGIPTTLTYASAYL